MPKTAFITGITGQDGAYLAAYLLGLGYDVHGLVRWDSYAAPRDGLARLEALDVDNRVTLHVGDLTDTANVMAVIKRIAPDEIYNLGAMSHVAVSFETPASTLDINTKGTLSILDAIRLLDMEKSVKIYQASSSEMFGSSPAPQNEDTPMHPCSPYGAAKLAAYWLAKTYRESYGMFVANGILFNHESPQRGEDFVTHKITRIVAEIEAGRDEPLTPGNLNSLRDWGHARDYVQGMHAMLQQKRADDFVLATGVAITVREFVERSFARIGKIIKWRGEGVDEIGVDAQTGRLLVRVDEQFFRPNEVSYLLGDAAKAQEILGWSPAITLDGLIADMLDYDRHFVQDQKCVSCQKTG